MGKVSGGARAISRRTPPIGGVSTNSDTYKIINSHAEAVSWSKTHFKDEQWDALHYNALREYTGSLYEQLNSKLRHDKMSATDQEYRYQKFLDEFFDTPAARLPENVMLYRDAGYNVAQQLISSGVGSVFEDKGFVSTGVVPRKGGYLVRIRASKGARGASLVNVSMFTYENEVLLPRGSKFRVVAIQPKVNDTTYIDVDLV